MKKLLLILFAALAASCSTSTPISTLQLIQGHWVCFGENGVNYPSDSVFAVEFKPDMTLTLSKGMTTSDGSQWGSDEGYTYAAQGDLLKVQNADNSINITAKINYISGATLICTIEEYTVDGRRVNNISQYTFQNANSLVLSTILPGLWSSRSSTNTQELEIWDLDEDMEMDYYIYDTRNETYIESLTQGGTYDVIGQYVVLNYPKTETKESTYDVWVVNNSHFGQVSWFTRNEDGSLTYKILSTMSSLPEVD